MALASVFTGPSPTQLLGTFIASLPLVPVVVIMAIYIAVQAFVPAMNPSPRNSAGAC